MSKLNSEIRSSCRVPTQIDGKTRTRLLKQQRCVQVNRLKLSGALWRVELHWFFKYHTRFMCVIKSEQKSMQFNSPECATTWLTYYVRSGITFIKKIKSTKKIYSALHNKRTSTRFGTVWLVCTWSSPPHPLVKPSLSSSPLSVSITPSLVHSRLKTYLFNKSFPP